MEETLYVASVPAVAGPSCHTGPPVSGWGPRAYTRTLLQAVYADDFTGSTSEGVGKMRQQ